MFADGKPIVEITDMSLRLTGLDRATVERTLAESVVATQTATAPVLNTREQILAFALGKPSEAFGEPFRPFDADRFLARLPAPPYSFLDRVVAHRRRALRPDGRRDRRGRIRRAGRRLVLRRRPPSADAVRRAPGNSAASLRLAGGLYRLGADERRGPVLPQPRRLGDRPFENVTPATGTLSNRIKMTKVSNSGGMIIQHFDFETRGGTRLVYQGDTYFGFFRREALAESGRHPRRAPRIV